MNNIKSGNESSCVHSSETISLMLDHDHDNTYNDSDATLLRQRSLRRAAHIQHSPVAVAHTLAGAPGSVHPRAKNTTPESKKSSFGITIATVSDAFRRIQAFRHARSSSTHAAHTSTSKTGAYHKRKSPHARSHSVPTSAETPSHTQTSAPSTPMHPSASAPAQLTRAAAATTRADVPVPPLLRQGTQMTKVTSKKRKKVVVRLDPDMGQIIWEVMQPAGRQRISACPQPAQPIAHYCY